MTTIKPNNKNHSFHFRILTFHMFLTTDLLFGRQYKVFHNKTVPNYICLMKQTHYMKKNIRLRTTLYNSKSGFMRNQANQSQKTISANKEHVTSIKTLNKIMPFQLKPEKSERYSGNLLSNTRTNFKSSRKFNASRLKKNPSHKKTASNIRNINLSALNLTTKSWCLFDQKQKVFLGFREEYKRQIASLTKIMTTIVSIEIMNKLGISPNSLVKITYNACNCIGTSASLKRDHWISLENLLYGTMLPSGNDAAYTLAEYIGYCMTYSKKHKLKAGYFSGVDKIDLTNQSTTLFVLQFIQQMNHLASKIGLSDSTFSNPHGLQNAMNISSAKDILELSVYAFKNQMFRRISNTIEHHYEMFSDDQCLNVHNKKWENTNRLLEKGWQGVKTGLTPSAGSCLSSIKEGVCIVVLNCSNHQTRFSDTLKIHSWYTNVYLPQNKVLKEKTKNKRLSTEQMEIGEMISTDIQN